MNTNKTPYNVTVILPSLNPDEKLGQVLDGLREYGFDDIVIINDGSSPEHLRFFPDPAQRPECTILTHEVNRGKGAALKTGFKYVIENREGSLGVVTVDGDNQHSAKDIAEVARALANTSETLILGARDFSLPHVPARSRRGNRTTSFVFRTGIGMKISDTQTGLRAIPASCLPLMLEVGGERFEYETNMLLALKKYHIPYREIPIETVYIDENKSTHFNPLRDSLRICATILKFVASSVVSSLLDLLPFFLVAHFFGHLLGKYSTLVSTLVARTVSSVVNFIVNKRVVFGAKGHTRSSMAKYFALVAVQAGVSALLVFGLAELFDTDSSVWQTVIKAPVDVFLFFVSYFIQREWVFKNRKAV